MVLGSSTLYLLKEDYMSGVFVGMYSQNPKR